MIKSHHNVGGLPDDMELELIEPLRDLFKDEVRALGTELGLPDEMVWRQPFPGPGLGVRIIGEVTPGKVALLQDADAIVREELAAAGLEREIWQSYAALLSDVRSVGVMGDERTYGNPIVIRAVTSRRCDDRRLGPGPVRRAREDVAADHQRGVRGQPGGLRHHLEAARHHRVGVTRRAATTDGVACRKAPGHMTESKHFCLPRNAFVIFGTLSTRPMKRRIAHFLVAASTLTFIVPLAFPEAVQASVSDQRREVERIVDELDRLHTQADILAEDWAEAEDNLRQLDQDVVAAEARVAAKEAELNALRGDLSEMAIRAFTGAGGGDVLGPLFSNAEQYGDTLAKDQFSRVALSVGHDDHRRSRRVRRRPRRRAHDLEQKRAEVAALKVTIEQKRQQTEDLTAQFIERRSEAEARLGQLIQEEEERRDAEALRSARGRTRGAAGSGRSVEQRWWRWRERGDSRTCRVEQRWRRGWWRERRRSPRAGSRR